MSDVRVPMSAVLEAFGVAGTVTRPAPDDAPINATVVWLPPLVEDVPVGMGMHRRAEIQVLSLAVSEVPTVPLSTLIVAPPLVGGVDKTWKVDSYLSSDAEHHRVIVIEVADA